MIHALVVASLDRAGDHAAVLGVLVMVAAMGGLVYGLARRTVRSRAERARSARGPERDGRPDT
jgi:hypothetical protein